MQAAKSYFTMGFNKGLFSRALGQTPSLSLNDRDQLLFKIQGAFEQAPAIDDWVSLHQPGDPDFSIALGPVQAIRFRDLLAQSQQVAGPVQMLEVNLESDNSADWVITQQDLTNVDTYANAVAAMTAMIQAPAYTPPTPGGGTPISTTSPQATVPGATPLPAQAKNAVPAAIQGNQILGIPAPVVYVGGGILGLIVIVAVAKAL